MHKLSVSRAGPRAVSLAKSAAATAPADIPPRVRSTRSRAGRIDLDLLAQIADDDAQVMRVIEMGVAPNLAHDLLARHDLAGVLRENLQDQIFLRTEDKALAADRPGPGGQIDFQ